MDFIRFFDIGPEGTDRWRSSLVRALNALAARIQGSVADGIIGLEDRVDILEDDVDAIEGRADALEGSALKCRAYITVSGGTPTLAGGENITSITDTGVGRVTVTIATDFANATWTASLTLDTAGTTVLPNYANKAAGSIELQAISLADAFTDPAAYDFLGFGDQ